MTPQTSRRKPQAATRFFPHCGTVDSRYFRGRKNQKDVLIVRDETTGEISVVAGLKKDGTPKTTAASGANQKDFLLFDKNSNPLDCS